MGIPLSEREVARPVAEASIDAGLPFGIPPLERGIRRSEYNPGQIMFGVGDPCESLVVLVAGEARLTRCAVDGQSVTLTSVQAPALFAEGVFLKAYPWEARATTPVVVAKINIDVLPTVFAVTPHLRRLVIEAFADYVPMLADLAEFLLSSTELRVGHKLRTMAVRQRDGSYMIENVPAQEQLALEVGSPRESINKAVRGLEKDGVIERVGKTWREGIRIPNIERLEGLAKRGSGKDLKIRV